MIYEQTPAQVLLSTYSKSSCCLLSPESISVQTSHTLETSIQLLSCHPSYFTCHLFACELHLLFTIATILHQWGKTNLSYDDLTQLMFPFYFFYSFYSCSNCICVNPAHVCSWLFIIIEGIKSQCSPPVIFCLAPCSPHSNNSICFENVTGLHLLITFFKRLFWFLTEWHRLLW